MYSVTVEGHFCAAHFLPGVPKCENLHGHNYKVEVEIRSRGLARGMLVNFDDVKEQLDKLLDKLDHKCLNDMFSSAGLYHPPTAENLARWFFDGLMAMSQDLPPYKVTVWETPRSRASYWKEHYEVPPS